MKGRVARVARVARVVGVVALLWENTASGDAWEWVVERPEAGEMVR